MFGLNHCITRVFASLPKPSLSYTAYKTAPFHSLTNTGSSNQSLTQRVGGLFDISIRNVIRVHFPRPNEIKRVRKHGWKKRMSDAAGRRILMNRILRGRHVYSH